MRFVTCLLHGLIVISQPPFDRPIRRAKKCPYCGMKMPNRSNSLSNSL